MENQERNNIKEWLDKIQQDSWQLELVVTAFSIFLLMGALEALYEMEPEMQVLIMGMGSTGTLVSISIGSLGMALLFMLINLVLHVILRGLWISAVGLRSVSGDIDFDKLGFSPRFDQFLRRKTGSFDNYIELLENLCSIVFAFTFLVVFVIISLGIWVMLILFISEFVKAYLPKPYDNYIVTTLDIALVFTGLLYMVDFMTLGWVKKRRRLSKVYYPFYRFFGVITLAALYRPMYYNLIDNKIGRRAAYLMIPYILTVIWLVSLQTDSHVWFAKDDRGSQYEMVKSPYDDIRSDKEMIETVSIPSKFVGNGYLELFIRYIPDDDDSILEKKCPEVKPPAEPGIRSGFYIDFGDGSMEEEQRNFMEASFECLSSLYELRINDSLLLHPKYRLFEHPNKMERGLLTILDVASLPRGEHEVTVRKLAQNTAAGSEALIMKDFARFPFWKE